MKILNWKKKKIYRIQKAVHAGLCKRFLPQVYNTPVIFLCIIFYHFYVTCLFCLWMNFTSVLSFIIIFNPVDKSNTENSKFLVVSIFVKTSKKVLNLATLLFDPSYLPPYCVNSFFEWTRGPIENTAKVKSFVYISYDYTIVPTFSRKVTWTLSSLPTTRLEEFFTFYIYILQMHEVRSIDQ